MFSFYSIRWSVAAALLASCGVPLWAAETLSLLEAQQRAADRSQQLVAQDAVTQSAREMAIAASQLPDPVLKFGLANLPINGPDQFSFTRDFMTMRSVGVMQEFTRRDKREARSARFEREADLGLAGRQIVWADLQRDTARAWLERFYLEQMLGLLVSQRDEARLQIEAADAAYRGGRGSQADLFAARSAVAQLEDRVAQAAQQIETAKIQLARWVGSPASKPLGAPPALDTVPLHAENLQTQLSHDPLIEMLTQKVTLAQTEVEIARANKRADISVELMYSQRGPAFSNMLSLNLSVPLQWDQKNRQNRELGAKLAAVEQMRAEREEGTRMHVAETQAMLQEWRSNRGRLARYDASLIPLATERTRAAMAAYRSATGPLTAILEARRGEIDLHMERLRLEMDTARLWAQLNYLVPIGQAPASMARPTNPRE